MKTSSRGRRKIIEIDEDLCTGCGECIPSCHEGALRIIDGKARLISDLFCDGLGACVGYCPEGAMRVIEREAEPYDERRPGVAGRFSLPCSCPSSVPMKLASGSNEAAQPVEEHVGPAAFCLENWPLQIDLVPAGAPYLNGADLLIAADCTAFASAAFHRELAAGRVVLIGCPKLDDASAYMEKLSRIILENDVRSVTVAHMAVPCCFGMVALVREAISRSRKELSCREVTVELDGGLK